MGNLRDESKLRNMQPTDVVLGADKDGCLVNFPPDNFSGSIPITIDTETGDGEELFTEPEVNNFLFKKIKSEDESIEFTTDTDGNIDASVNFPTPPTVDYPVTGAENVKTDDNAVGIYKQLSAKKIQLKSLVSEDIIISEDGDDIRFSLAGGGSSSNDWYLDANFERPTNWGQTQNPKEEITYLSSMAMIDPAIYTNGQVVKVPSGMLNDPFKTYEEYLLKRIYGAGGSGTGTPSKHNPKYPVKTLQLLSSFSTSSDLEVINTTLYLKNFITLTYTGTRLYGLDYRTIYDALTVSSNLQITIDNIIKGEGTITSVNNFGLIYHKSNSAKTSNGNFCLLKIEPEGKGIYFIEGNNNVAYVPLTKNGGGDLKYGNKTVQGVNQAPTIPLIVIEGTNFNFWNTFLTGTSIFIQTNTQIGIRYFNDGKITSSLEKLLYQVGNDRIGYETRIDDTATGVNLQIVNFYEDATNGKVYYKAHDSYCMFRGEDTSLFRVENMGTVANSFNSAGMNSIVSLSGSAKFEVISTTSDVGGAPALNFLKSSGSTTAQSFNNSDINSKYFNFIKGDGTNTVEVNFKKSEINPANIQTDVATLIVDTKGTWSSIKSIPINTGIIDYASSALAVSAGYITGMSYFNTTENAISRVP